MSDHARSVRDGLWRLSEEGTPRLIGSKCGHCGELYFPKREKGICLNCQRSLQEVLLGPNGEVFSFTRVMQRPPIYYKGPVPYVLAWVQLAEGVRVESLLTGLRAGPWIGMPVRLVIETLHDEPDGTTVCAYKFTPAQIRYARASP